MVRLKRLRVELVQAEIKISNKKCKITKKFRDLLFMLIILSGQDIIKKGLKIKVYIKIKPLFKYSKKYSK